MRKKSILAVVAAVMVFAGTAEAEVVGRHAIHNFSEEQAAIEMAAHQGIADITDIYVGVDVNSISLKYYDSLASLLLALVNHEVDSITVPRPVGRYILENNTSLTLKGFNWWNIRSSASMNFGFLEENAGLMKRFNEALDGMKSDGTLAVLEKKYVDDFRENGMIPAKFESFDDAETITVAVTGDLPPMDYINADGTPAGFNAAVLSEIAKRLHVNLKIMNIETGARIAALSSGRADVIFWVHGNIDSNVRGEMCDTAEGLITSKPYYTWHEHYFISSK